MRDVLCGVGERVGEGYGLEKEEMLVRKELGKEGEDNEEFV